MNMHKNNKSFHFNTNLFGCIGSFCLTTLTGDYSLHRTCQEFCTHGQLAQSASYNTRNQK